MNPHFKIAAVKKTDISPEEWQARTDLAAAYRLIAHYGWGDVIYNHSSMRVPGEERKFLIKRHELLYTEVTASNLVKVSMDDDLDESAGVNRPGFTLHGGVLSARPDANCAVHVHTEIGMALAGLKHGLRMVSQPAVRLATMTTKASPRISASVSASTRRSAKTARSSCTITACSPSARRRARRSC
jgi:ribulose-5-phosphate 4-epimerase/fuculose-1-phosphate aldolase